MMHRAPSFVLFVVLIALAVSAQGQDALYSYAEGPFSPKLLKKCSKI